jgi:hypothetical protein
MKCLGQLFLSESLSTSTFKLATIVLRACMSLDEPSCPPSLEPPPVPIYPASIRAAISSLTAFAIVPLNNENIYPKSNLPFLSLSLDR